jgi:outer membrane protein OmpA-like peptidoglycan-associated protein
MECAKAQAYWDQYMESLFEGANACISAEDAKAMFDEALAACRGVMGDFIVYFGFDRSNIDAAAKMVITDVVSALAGYTSPLVSLVGHTDTVGSVQYNQGLSERRANSVDNAIHKEGNERSVNVGTITKSGRSELEPAVDTGDNVREPRNRRVTIAISE